MHKSIAVLAPEIPSLSTPFVYEEILSLEGRGTKVIPLSIHVPQVPAFEKTTHELSLNTHYIYKASWIYVLRTNFCAFIRKPLCYFRALSALTKDLWFTSSSFAWIKLVYQFIRAGLVADILLRTQSQHLHIHFSHVPTQVGMYASLMSNVPFTFVVHANDIFVHQLLIRQKADRSKAVICISNYNHNYLCKEGIAPDKLRVVRCGIPTKQIGFKNTRGISQSFKIGSLGRLVDKKGMDVLVIAISILVDLGYDCELDIAGDGPLRDELISLASLYEVDSRVHFLGALPHDTVFSWLSSLDIFVLACKPDRNRDQDGIPVVLMEAMAVGIPVVSTYLSGIPELIQNHETGFLAQPNDPNSLASAISSVVLDPNIHQVTTLARSHICQEFDREVNLDRLLAIINES